jgi:uncharacterized protein YjbI with pentapeptide repeats
MMKFSRRRFLSATATLSLKWRSRATRKARVSQSELNEAIFLHGRWLADINSGQRCSFAGRDLSGLRFGVLGGPPVNLSGADFVQANLSGTEADDILFHHCNFNGATFGECSWEKPVFAFADMRRVSARQVRWGVPDLRRSPDRLLVDFSHVALCDADLSGARVCGFFYGANLNGACARYADLSFSEFIGPKFGFEMSFFRTDLTGAQLNHCKMANVSFFNANCCEADFAGSSFTDVQIKRCSLKGAHL